MRSRLFTRFRADSGSLPIAMLFTLLGLGLSGLLITSMLTQVVATRRDIGRVRALNAAQAGLDVMLGHVRAAVDTGGAGLLGGLPCLPLSGLLTGSISGKYDTSVQYFSANPQGRAASWLLANLIQCVPGAGTPITPSFALLRSTGTDTSATGPAGQATTRSLRATYTLRTSDVNIPGGLIHAYKVTGSLDLCLDAGSSSPAAGTLVLMEPCSAGSQKQTFSYNANLTLTLVSSRTTALPLGMCLDAGTPHTVGLVVKFVPCTPVTLPQQQWSINDSANFEGTANGKTLDGYCFNVQNVNTPDSPLILNKSPYCRASYDNRQNFQAEPSAGAGAASAASGQLVNFKQFGRCLDVTGQSVSAAYLIAWNCKQAPDPANLSWNQRWVLPAVDAITHLGTGRITTNPAGVAYCLHSPLSTAAAQYVKVLACPATLGPDMLWTVTGDTGTYSTSYRIVDNSGYCLSPTDPSAPNPDLFSNGLNVSKIIVAKCDATTLQKWNAPPGILEALPLKDIGEN